MPHVTVGGYRFFYGMPSIRATAVQPNREANDERKRDQQSSDEDTQDLISKLIPRRSLKVKYISDRRALKLVWQVITQLSMSDIASVIASIRDTSLGGILAALAFIIERAQKMLIIFVLPFLSSDEEEENRKRKCKTFPRSYRHVLPKRRCSS